MPNYLDRDRRPITPLATGEARTSWYRRPHVASSISASAVAVFAVGLATTGIYNRYVDASSGNNSVPKTPETSLVQPTPSPEPPTREPAPEIQPAERTPMLDELETLAEETIERIRMKSLQYRDTSQSRAAGGNSKGSVYWPRHGNDGSITGLAQLFFTDRRTDLNPTRDLERVSGASLRFRTPLPPDSETLDGAKDRIEAFVLLQELPDGNWRFGTGSRDIPEGPTAFGVTMNDTAFSTLLGDVDTTYGIVFTQPTSADIAALREDLNKAIDQM